MSGARAAGLPDWLAPIEQGARDITADDLTRFVPPVGSDARRGAVLMLFGEGPQGPDLLLTERAHDMRSHPGQVSFPGGSMDPCDTSPAAAALREAVEETGLDPAGVDPLAVLPELFLAPSGFGVRPVLAHWRVPSPVHAVDLAESARVARIPLSELLDPAHRFRVRHPSGYTGPAFAVRGLLVWGFTGGVLSSLLDLAGWGRPWDTDDVRDLDASLAAVRARPLVDVQPARQQGQPCR